MTMPSEAPRRPWTRKMAFAGPAVALIALLAAGCDGTPTGPTGASSSGLSLQPSNSSAGFIAASGTVMQTAVLSEAVGFAGPNTIVDLTIAATLSGTLSGTIEDSFRLVIHPNAKFTAQGTTTCVCTVNGMSGIVELRLTDTGEIVGGVPRFSGRWVIVDATGELSGLYGVLQVDGEVDIGTGLSTTDYSGWIRFHP